MDSVLVIHIGAGRHLSKNTRIYKNLLKSALNADDLIDASHVIERSPMTNTGVGSSLDRVGGATSDACLMEIAGHRVTNNLALINIYDDAFPTSRVHQVLRNLEKEYEPEVSLNSSFGLSRPSSLDYRSYIDYLKSLPEEYQDDGGFEAPVAGHDKKSLISKKALAHHDRFTSYFEEKRKSLDEMKKAGATLKQRNIPEAEKLQYPRITKRTLGKIQKDQKPAKKFRGRESVVTSNLASEVGSSPHGVEDTVGYIELSPTKPYHTRLACSSGGNFYRLPGRVSCAGVLGAATGYSRHNDIEVSCLCSGNGDDIISMNLAAYLSASIAESISESEEWPALGPLLQSRILRKSQQFVKTAVDFTLDEVTYVGVVMVVKSPNLTRLVFCHSTETFYFGFRSKGVTELVLSRLDQPMGSFVNGEYKL